MTTRSQSCTEAGSTPPRGLPAPREVLGRAGSENFAVASRLLPAAARAHLLAFYGFARFTDQIGDAYQGDRLAALDWLQDETTRALADTGWTAHPLVAPAARSVNELGLDDQPLFDLIEANRRDQSVHSYASFEELVGYCALSANPVGRLVLGAFGYEDPAMVTASDSVCTGLQLVEHWQDVREDAMAGRVYLPADDLQRFGIDPSMLLNGPSAPQSLRALMAFEVARARDWLQPGTALAAGMSGRARMAVAGFVAGGRAALDDLAAKDFDVLTPPRRPRPLSVTRQLLLMAPWRTRAAA